jgi:uncharacterized RDD family membrane protein YckC
MTAAQPTSWSSLRRQYAGLVSRLLALTVDAVLLTIGAAAIGVGVPTLWDAVTGSTPDWLEVAAGTVAAVLPFAYFWLSWSVSGSTIGELLFGFAVRRTDGSRVGVARAALRAFLGLLFAPIWLVGMLLTVSDPLRRALHDVLMGTATPRMP